MRGALLLPLAFLLAGPAAAQVRNGDFDVPVIIASGVGQVERPADWYDFHASLNGQGRTQVEALRSLKAAQDAVEASLREMAGLRAVRLETRGASVAQTWSADCQRRYDNERDRAASGDCRPTGYSAYAGTTVRVWPAERAGSAMSLAAERGAREVRLEDSGVDAPETLRRAAIEAAVRDARAQAEAAARGSGATLGPLLRVADPTARTSIEGGSEVESVVVTGSRIRPSVEINVAPPPVRETARISAVFQIGR